MEENIQMHERMAGVETKVEAIMTNHLPHLQEDLKEVKANVRRVDSRLWWVLGVIVLGFLTTIATSVYFK